MSTPTNPGRSNAVPVIDRPITEEWLRTHHFKIQDHRKDRLFPLFRLPIACHKSGSRGFMESSDDLCIDVSPAMLGECHVWICQVEPYRHIHVRCMRWTWELVQLYQGLTGVVWFGTL